MKCENNLHIKQVILKISIIEHSVKSIEGISCNKNNNKIILWEYKGTKLLNKIILYNS